MGRPKKHFEKAIPEIVVPNEKINEVPKSIGDIPVEKVSVITNKQVRETIKPVEVRVVKKSDFKKALAKFNFNMPDLGITDDRPDWHISITEKDITLNFQVLNGQRRTVKL
jgi:hypothetical protein